MRLKVCKAGDMCSHHKVGVYLCFIFTGGVVAKRMRVCVGVCVCVCVCVLEGAGGLRAPQV